MAGRRGYEPHWRDTPEVASKKDWGCLRENYYKKRTVEKKESDSYSDRPPAGNHPHQSTGAYQTPRNQTLGMLEILAGGRISIIMTFNENRFLENPFSGLTVFGISLDMGGLIRTSSAH
jgi:hypothetical protein